MRRRTVLATSATLLTATLAGCSNPGGSLSLDAVDTDAALADRFARPGDDYDGERGRVLKRAVAGERPTHNATEPLFENEPPESARPIAYDGHYYNVSNEAVGEFEHTSYEIEMDLNPPTDDGSSRDAVRYVDLPEVDRRVVSGFLSARRDAPDNEGTDVGTSKAYSPAEERASVLVSGEYDAVSHGGTSYQITVSDGSPVTVTQYRYDASQVAADESELATQVRDRYLFSLDGLSEDQREIVDTAVDQGSYAGDDPPTKAFAALVDEFRANRAIEESEYDGTWLVRYDGSVYWADVYFPTATPTNEG